MDLKRLGLFEMGIRAGLTEVSTEAFTKVKDGGEFTKEDLLDRVSISIDKSWYGINEAFTLLEPPLKYIICGDFSHPLSAPDIVTFINGNDDFYVGLMSPELVQEIATNLDFITDEKIGKLFKQCELEFDDYFQHHFNKLKRAYLDAAQKGNSLYICIA
jgi:hypothetical protein